jgi:hypothetical protein
MGNVGHALRCIADCPVLDRVQQNAQTPQLLAGHRPHASRVLPNAPSENQGIEPSQCRIVGADVFPQTVGKDLCRQHRLGIARIGCIRNVARVARKA